MSIRGIEYDVKNFIHDSALNDEYNLQFVTGSEDEFE